MTSEIKLTGGARVGWINASWPFAALTVLSSKVTLNSTLLGKYEFRPEDIISFEEVGTLPFIGRGIRIHHNKTEYPKKMIFWTTKNPEKLINEIRMLGFIPKGTPSTEVRDRRFPIRWQAIVFFVVLWNSFLMLDMFQGGEFHPKPGRFSWYATMLVFILSISIWKTELIKNAILSPGHKLTEIKSLLYLLTFVTGILSLILGWELIQ
jgi:hypothetical protein